MAKQFDHLYPQLCRFENLYLAYRKAAKGKRGKIPAATFEIQLEKNLFDLQEELVSQQYVPGSYQSFYIQDPKKRLISAAPFRDRVVHHALCNIIEPIFERTFIGDSYANRIGKGNHKALDRAQDFSKRYPFVLQCDIRQFFPSIDHHILFQVLQRKVADQKVLWLCRLILSTGIGVLTEEYDMVYFKGDTLFAANRPRGLPIGNLTSQFWGNVYLNELDQYIKRELRVSGYLRYVDDFLLFSENKRQLWEWKDAVREKLAAMRLTMHEKRSSVFPVSTGIPFLGFRVYPSHRLLKRDNGVAFFRRMKIASQAYCCGEISRENFHARIQGWIAHAQHGNTWALRRSLLRKIKI